MSNAASFQIPTTGDNNKIYKYDEAQDNFDLVSTNLSTSANPNALTGSPTLVAWYVANTITGSTGDSVSAWADSSASAYDLSQGTAGKQPTLRVACPHFNGHKAVRFDGTDDTLTRLATGASSMATHSAFGVFYNPNTIATHYVLDARGTNFLDVAVLSSAYAYRAGGSAAAASGKTGDNKGVYVVVGVYDGSTIYLWVNGKLVGLVATTGAMTPTNIYIGSNGDVNGYTNCDIAETGMYSTALSVAQVAELTNGLATKYAVAALMPL